MIYISYGQFYTTAGRDKFQVCVDIFTACSPFIQLDTNTLTATSVARLCWYNLPQWSVLHKKNEGETIFLVALHCWDLKQQAPTLLLTHCCCLLCLSRLELDNWAAVSEQRSPTINISAKITHWEHTINISLISWLRITTNYIPLSRSMSVGTLDTSLWESHHHIHTIWMSERNKYFPRFHSKGHNLSCDAEHRTWQHQFNHLQIVHSWLWAGNPQLECLIMKSTKHDETIHDYQTRFRICFFFNFKPIPFLLY